MVGFDGGADTLRTLDGKAVPEIHANLTANIADITTAHRLASNLNIAFMGDTKGGKFDIEESLALEMLRAPNPHGLPNSDVIVPWANGKGLSRRIKIQFIIDFGVIRPEAECSKYELPFQHVTDQVKDKRMKNNRPLYAKYWWRHVEPRPGMKELLAPLARFVGTVRHTKHRLFFWMEAPTLPDSAMFAFASADDSFFGVLHSRTHEVWARAQATQVRERSSGLRYTPSSCFEPFPFPHPTAAQEAAIAASAKELSELRERWLNPPEWTVEKVLEFPGTKGGPWDRYIAPATVDAKTGIGTVRYPRLEPKDADCAAKLKKRTLTNLYNERPAWLDLAHKKLDAAVAAAYGWPAEISDEQLLEKLLTLNLERAAEEARTDKRSPKQQQRERASDELV